MRLHCSRPPRPMDCCTLPRYLPQGNLLYRTSTLERFQCVAATEHEYSTVLLLDLSRQGRDSSQTHRPFRHPHGSTSLSRRTLLAWPWLIVLPWGAARQASPLHALSITRPGWPKLWPKVPLCFDAQHPALDILFHVPHPSHLNDIESGETLAINSLNSSDTEPYYCAPRGRELHDEE